MQSTQKKPLTAFTVISTIILLLLTVLFIFPFYWILTGAFKSQPDTIMFRHNGSLKCQPWKTSNNSWCKTLLCSGCGTLCLSHW